MAPKNGTQGRWAAAHTGKAGHTTTRWPTVRSMPCSQAPHASFALMYKQTNKQSNTHAHLRILGILLLACQDALDHCGHIFVCLAGLTPCLGPKAVPAPPRAAECAPVQLYPLVLQQRACVLAALGVLHTCVGA
eukprot:1161380-Pelagomonas_calceolata.AAC.18